MTHSKEGCPDGWDPAELLAYLEEDIEASSRAALEEHLRGCSICSDALDSLRKWDALLREHPESFHPDPEDLYRLVSRGEDPAGHTKNHVESCRTCTEAVGLLQEMISAEAEVPAPPPAIPASLVSKLEEVYGVSDRVSRREQLPSFFRRLLGIRFRLPVLALGTAAAAAIIIVLVMPARMTEPPRPGEIAPSEAPRRSIGPEQQPASRDQLRLPDEHTRETRSPDLTRMREESPAQPSLPPRSLPSVQEGASEPDSHRAKEGLLDSAPRKTSKLRSFTAPATPESQLEKKIAPPPATGDIKWKTRQDVGAGRVAKPGPAVAELRQAPGIPVRVQIVDSTGHPVPGLKFVPPKALDSRFSFSGPASSEESVAGKVQMKSEAESAPTAIAENEAKGYLVVVTVKESQGVFDIDAKLFEAPSAQGEAPTSTISARNVSKEDLQSRIGELVVSLLGIE